jgi:hypothetical protein
MQDPAAKETIYTLANGRVYKVVDTGREYIDGEYPSGGFLITTQLVISKEWSFIDYSPDAECVANFLRFAERLPRLEEIKGS